MHLLPGYAYPEGAIPFAARDPMRVILPPWSVDFKPNPPTPNPPTLCPGDPACGRITMQYLLDCPGTIACGLMYALLKPSEVAQTVQFIPCRLVWRPPPAFLFPLSSNRHNQDI